MTLLRARSQSAAGNPLIAPVIEGGSSADVTPFVYPSGAGFRPCAADVLAGVVAALMRGELPSEAAPAEERGVAPSAGGDPGR